MRVLRGNWVTLLVIAGLALGYVLLRTPDSAMASAEQLVADLSAGNISVIEFYSNG